MELPDDKTQQAKAALLEWAGASLGTNEFYEGLGLTSAALRDLEGGNPTATIVPEFFASVASPVIRSLVQSGKPDEARRVVEHLDTLPTNSGQLLGETPEGEAALAELSHELKTYLQA